MASLYVYLCERNSPLQTPGTCTVMQLSEEVRHACTNHYKFSALMSLRSRDNVQTKCTELVVIRARMSDLLCAAVCMIVNIANYIELVHCCSSGTLLLYRPPLGNNVLAIVYEWLLLRICLYTKYSFGTWVPGRYIAVGLYSGVAVDSFCNTIMHFRKPAAPFYLPSLSCTQW